MRTTVALPDRITTIHPAATPPDRPILGIVGGGQLGRMLLQAAAPLGIDVRVLVDDADAPAARIWPHCTIGPTDGPTLMAFAASVDVLTFEHEHLGGAALATLDATDTEVRPSVATLATTGDKVAHRRRLLVAGIPVLPFIEAPDPSALRDAVRIVSTPAVLKARRGGFDGRGVRFLYDGDGALAAASELGWPVLVEPMLNHEAELSVLVARRPCGDVRVYPVIRTVQVGGTCRVAELPSGLSEELEREAQVLAVRVAHLLDAVGILAVELFLIGGVLAVNEVAARPHNSGHVTIEACETSQFENHLRAVLDWPLGPTDLTVPAATMANVLAADSTSRPHAVVPEVLRAPGVRVHLYDKDPWPGRKIGHVTATGHDVALTRADALGAAETLAAARADQAR